MKMMMTPKYDWQTRMPKSMKRQLIGDAMERVCEDCIEGAYDQDGKPKDFEYIFDRIRVVRAEGRKGQHVPGYTRKHILNCHVFYKRLYKQVYSSFQHEEFAVCIQREQKTKIWESL